MPYAGFRLLEIAVFNRVKKKRTSHNSPPPPKKSSGVKSGDLGGQAIGASLPIHPPSIM